MTRSRNAANVNVAYNSLDAMLIWDMAIRTRAKRDQRTGKSRVSIDSAYQKKMRSVMTWKNTLNYIEESIEK
jgi:hypothetical protein